jgi:hypothetical protein
VLIRRIRNTVPASRCTIRCSAARTRCAHAANGGNRSRGRGAGSEPVRAKARLREAAAVPAARLESGRPSKEPLTFSWAMPRNRGEMDAHRRRELGALPPPERGRVGVGAAPSADDPHPKAFAPDQVGANAFDLPLSGGNVRDCKPHALDQPVTQCTSAMRNFAHGFGRAPAR